MGTEIVRLRLLLSYLDTHLTLKGLRSGNLTPKKSRTIPRQPGLLSWRLHWQVVQLGQLGRLARLALLGRLAYEINLSNGEPVSKI